MVLSTSSDELLRSVRDAAGTTNVRQAVRDLTLHALRSRRLTARHIVTVARTVGEGIESSAKSPAVPVREVHRGAWAGLEDAVGRALFALELAAREFAEGRACLSHAERDQWLAEIAEMERSFGAGWRYPRIVPASQKARIASLTAILRDCAGPAEVSAEEGSPGAGRLLSLLASGALLGLSATLREPADNRSDNSGVR